MANRDHLLRDLILSPRGQLTIPSANADRETRKAIRELTEGDSPRADYAAGMLDLTAHPDDERLDAVTMHNVLAVARNILLTVTTPTREDAIAAHFAPSGFTPEMVRDGVNFLRRDRLATRRDGVVTVNVPAPAKRPSLPNELLAPRNTTAAHATSTSTSANARPNMPVDERMIQPPDQRVDMGARLRAQAESMPSASFEVGDTSTAAAKPTVKEKPAAPTIPDSVLVAFTESVLDMWARHGKPSGKWAELPWDLPTVELSEGITSDDVVHRVFDKLIGNGVVRQDGEIFTYVPAERAVSETVDFLTRFIGHVSFDTHTRADLHRDASGVAAPAGWTTATITDLALAELVADGTLTVDGDVFTRVAKSEPKPVAPAPVETPAPKPEAVAPERKPAGDTTSSTTDPKPEGTTPVAPASGQETPATDPADAPETGDIERRLAALEKTAETTVDGVRAIYTKADRIEALVSNTTIDRSRVADAPEAVREVLVTIAAKLHRAAKDAAAGKREDPTLTNNEVKKSLSNRPLRGETVAARDRFEDARQLGIRTGVIRTAHRSRLAFVSFEPLMESDDFARRLANMSVRVAARTKGLVDAATHRVGAK